MSENEEEADEFS